MCGYLFYILSTKFNQLNSLLLNNLTEYAITFCSQSFIMSLYTNNSFIRTPAPIVKQVFPRVDNGLSAQLVRHCRPYRPSAAYHRDASIIDCYFYYRATTVRPSLIYYRRSFKKTLQKSQKRIQTHSQTLSFTLQIHLKLNLTEILLSAKPRLQRLVQHYPVSKKLILSVTLSKKWQNSE